MSGSERNLKEVAGSAAQNEAQRERTLLLLRRYAENSMSYLTLERDKQCFFSESVEGVAGYALSGRDMVLCSDPICAPGDLGEFLEDLKKFAHRIHYRIIILFTLGKNLPIYRAAGFGFYKTGEEAVFDLESYNMSGGKAAKVRASVHQAARDGLTVREYAPRNGTLEEIERQFFEISDAWLKRKHTSLLKFALGGIGFHEVNDKRYFYAADRDGVIQGFMVFLPYRQGQGYLVDVMRRRPGCTHGVMELIFHDAYEKMKAEGVRYGSLGIAPFANTEVGSRDTMIERLEHYNYENMNDIYGFKPLYEAKAKYAPTAWEPAYLTCLPRHLTLSMARSALGVLDTRGFSDYVSSFFRNRRRAAKNSVGQG